MKRLKLFNKTKSRLLLILLFISVQQISAQDTYLKAEIETKETQARCLYYADSIRQTYIIPQIAYAVITAESILEIQVVGFQRIRTDFKATLDDRFHIGSNTKAVTAFIAAKLIKEKKLSWDTKFFSFFPELRSEAKKVYFDITLADLLSFRGKLPSYTYTFTSPTRKQITGNEDEQRYQLAKYFIRQNPMKEENGLTASNVDYSLFWG